MKKRKVKLFASIASLGLVVAVMGVGVWAATQQAVKVSSQVSFTATSVAADITLQVHNNADLVEANAGDLNGTGFSKMDIVEKASISEELDDKGKYKYKDTLTLTNTAVGENDETIGSLGVEQYVARFVNDTAKTFYDNRVYLKVADKDEDGYLNVGAQVVYEFIIKAHASSAPIYYELYANLSSAPIPGTDYTIDEVFDVTVTDTYNTTFSETTNVTESRTTNVTISNWTTAPAGGTTTDPNAIQPDITGDSTGKQKATTPDNLKGEGAIIHTYGEERRITVTYTVRDFDGASSALYQGISYTMTSLELGDIYIKVANSGTNLNNLPDIDDPINKNVIDKVVDWASNKKTNIDGRVLGDGEQYPPVDVDDDNQ
ncbi:MAG: hypothetical protein IJF22_02370 [Clostridia bacterium]|nr:hypothetical protein [Clostridia bacterium]